MQVTYTDENEFSPDYKGVLDQVLHSLRLQGSDVPLTCACRVVSLR